MLTIAEIRACSCGICSFTPNRALFREIGLFSENLGSYAGNKSTAETAADIRACSRGTCCVMNNRALLKEIRLFCYKLYSYTYMSTTAEVRAYSWGVCSILKK